MSTFGGKIQEIPQISVDRFDGVNLEAEAYFLSHCHSDHMQGLYDGLFQNMVIKENKFLYASQISCTILKKAFHNLKDNVRELFLYKPTTVILKTKSISVIPIPAGHCPGSVMFLFENNKRILYTGDYRIHSDDIKKIKPFYDCFGRIKNIDKIYLDTTFFLEDYYMFPKRDDSIEEVCSIVKEWIERGNNFILHLKTSAKYGYEYVFAKIYEKTRMPVHAPRVLKLALPTTKQTWYRNVSTTPALLTPKVQQPAPNFSGIAVINEDFKTIQLSDYKGKYVVLVFYPLDFTFVCPTELIALDEQIDEFRKLNAEVIGCSIDSHFSHLGWMNTKRSEGGLGKLRYPLLSDINKEIAKTYDVLLPEDGIALRGLFIIDPNGILRHITINDLPIGRSVDEALRVIEALRFVEEHGEVCPANWKKGQKTIKPDPKGSQIYFKATHS